MLNRVPLFIGITLLAVLLGLFLWALTIPEKDANRTEASVVIDRPRAEVYRWLTEPALMKEWLPGLTTVESEGSELWREGNTLRQVFEVGDQRQEVEVQVEAAQPGERLVLRMTSELFVANVTYTLALAGGGTRLSLLQITEYGSPMAQILAPVITQQAQERLTANLQRLKERAEGGG